MTHKITFQISTKLCNTQELRELLLVQLQSIDVPGGFNIIPREAETLQVEKI